MKRFGILAAVAGSCLALAGGAQAATLTSYQLNPSVTPNYVAPDLEINAGPQNTSVGGLYVSPYGYDGPTYESVQGGGSATYNLSGNLLTFLFGTVDNYNTITFLNTLTGASDIYSPASPLTFGSNYLVSIRSDIDFNSVVFSSGQNAFEFSNVAVSSVPLPASAPLFGAALLALGGLGYGAKRKKAAAAAA